MIWSISYTRNHTSAYIYSCTFYDTTTGMGSDEHRAEHHKRWSPWKKFPFWALQATPSWLLLVVNYVAKRWLHTTSNSCYFTTNMCFLTAFLQVFTQALLQHVLYIYEGAFWGADTNLGCGCLGMLCVGCKLLTLLCMICGSLTCLNSYIIIIRDGFYTQFWYRGFGKWNDLSKYNLLTRAWNS